MPYYREYSIHDFLPGKYVSRTHLGDGTIVIVKQGENLSLAKASIQTSYRSKGPRGNVHNVVVPDATADPYVVFQSVNSVKKLAATREGFDTSWVNDRGHPWEFIQLTCEGSRIDAKLRNKTPAYYTSEVSGARATTADASYNGFMGFQAPSTFNLASYAATTYGKAAPTMSMFNLTQFLGELREGLPRLAFDTLTKAKFFKGLGSDYLNVQFGWKPFISDLQNAFHALQGASTALFGPFGPIHRSRSAADVNSGDWLAGSAVKIALTTNNLGIASHDYKPFNKVGTIIPGSDEMSALLLARVDASKRSTLKSWFEGEFMYLPKAGFNPDSYLDRLTALMNTDITPSVLWELSPWSWLVDWFLHIGDAIQANETASSNQILSSYAYAMSELDATNGAVFSDIRSASTARVYDGPKTAVTQWRTLHRRRLRANPYGYSVNPTSSLNVGQWAILAALGFTKAGR